MNTQLRLFLMAGLVLVMLIFMKAIKDKRLELQYTITWLALLLAGLILVIFPRLLSLISRWVGIAVPVNTLFFLGFCFSVVLIYRLTLVVSKQSNQITKLTQEIAILKKKVKEEKQEKE